MTSALEECARVFGCAGGPLAGAAEAVGLESLDWHTRTHARVVTAEGGWQGYERANGAVFVAFG